MHNHQSKGKIVIPSGVDFWEHELRVAKLLAAAGHSITFVPRMDTTKTADILLDGTEFEIKSPKSDKITAIERNLKRASRQSRNIIIDSHRMRRIQDRSIQQYLVTKLKQQKTIRKLLFINRADEIVDINLLI